MTDELPPGWAEAVLSDVFDNLDSQRVPINSAERAQRLATDGDRYPYYGATGQVGEIDEFLFDGQAVLLGEDGAPFLDARKRKAYLVGGKYWVNNHAHILRAKSEMSNAFFCHQLNAINYRPYVAGTTRLKLTQAAMNEIKLVVAPVAEQQRIVSKIDELFSRIDEGERALERVQKLVERYRQSVLKAAVTGELTRDWREKNQHQLESGEALLARILKARREAWEKAELDKMKAKGIPMPANDKWKQKYEEPAAPDITGLPELPEGWAWASLGTLLTWGPQNGLYLHRGKYGRGVPILRIDDYQAGWARPAADLQKVDAERADRERYAVAVGDFIINRVNSVTHLGKCLLVGIEHDGCLFESNMMRFRVSEELSNPYLELFLRSEIGRELLIRNCKHAVNQASINQDDVAATPIAIGPLSEQEEVVDRVGRELSRSGKESLDTKAFMKQAQGMRQGILRAAFNGTLVPQRPDDEPALALLERIAAERRDTQATSKRGRRKNIPTST